MAPGVEEEVAPAVAPPEVELGPVNVSVTVGAVTVGVAFAGSGVSTVPIPDGVGGGGGNAVNNMIQSGMTGVDFVVVNTDAQDLERSLAPRRFQLGGQLTKGLGAGADPEVGR